MPNYLSYKGSTNVIVSDILHKGKKGMKWGYNDGKKNGKRRMRGDEMYYIGATNVIISDDLQHHGILGMRWGERRFRDGSLTPAGVDRYRKVASSGFKSRRDRREAIRIHKRKQKMSDVLAKLKEKEAKKHDLEADKKDVDIGRYGLYSRKQTKQWKLDAADERMMAESLREKAFEYMEKAEVYKQTIKDLKRRDLEAGRDYIIQRDYYLFPNHKKTTFIDKKLEGNEKGKKELKATKKRLKDRLSDLYDNPEKNKKTIEQLENQLDEINKQLKRRV